MSRPPEPLHFGNYQVLQRPDGSHWLLGEGGYGRTYKAEHRFLRRVCALKIIHERYMRDERQRARFLQEAQTAARLSHRGIAHVYDFGEADGVFFYAMEFCEGGTLEELSRRLGAMGWPEVAEFGGQVAEALACAHGAGLLHRDLKPQNVMLAAPEQPYVAKLIDFGLVKVLAERDADTTWAMISREAGFKGNYATASPEQTGEDESLDERSDLFSLGVILWWLLIGHNPFDGMPNARVIADRLSPESYEPRLPDGLDPRARAVVARLLEKRPADRFASANELLAALGEMYSRPAASSSSSTAPPVQSAASTSASTAGPAASAASAASQAPQRLGFEETFEVVATLDELAVGKLYRCRDGGGAYYSALVVEAGMGRVAQEGMRRLGPGRVCDCFEWFGEWRGEGGQQVLVFGDMSPLRLLEVLKMLGGARLVELAPLLGKLARGLDGVQRDLGLGLELNPHIVRIAGRGGNAVHAWLDLDAESLRTVPRLMLDEEANELSADTTIVSGDADFPVSAQFPALVYRLVSGIPVKHAAYFTSAAYVPVAALSEEGNRMLGRLISSEESWAGAGEFLEELAAVEGMSAEFFHLRGGERVVVRPAEPVAVRHVLEQQALMAREQVARQAQEESARRLREEAERQAREMAERKAREEAERRVRAEAEARERAEAAARVARLQAERKAEEEAARRAKEEAEARVRAEAEARAAADLRAAEEGKRKVREEAERKVREAEAARLAKEAAERKVREEAERKVRDAERQQREAEAARLAKEESERKLREAAERKVREEEEARLAREETVRRAREAAERKALAEEEARVAREEAKRAAEDEAARKAAEKAQLKAAKEARHAASAGRRRKPVVALLVVGLLALGGGAAVLVPRLLKPAPQPEEPDRPRVTAGHFPTLRSTADNLRAEDYRIRDRNGSEAEWNEETGRWKFAAEPTSQVRVVLRDGLVFENLWKSGGSPVNQAEFPLGAVDLGGVRQVCGVELPALKRSAEGAAEPAREAWVEVREGGKPVKFRLEGAAAGGARRRVLWLEPVAVARTSQPGGFIERAAAEVSAAPMAEGAEVVVQLPGFRPQRFKHGDAVPAELSLARAAVAAQLQAAPGGQSGYAYQSLVVQRLDDPTDGADPPPAEGVRVAVADLADGKPLELPSGRYRLAFRGSDEKGDDQLLATAALVVPDSCPEAGRLLVPAELPGVDVKVTGKALDFKTLEIKPVDGPPPAPAALQFDADELVLGWQGITPEDPTTEHRIDLWQLVEKYDGEAEVLVHPVKQRVSFSGSLLPANLMPEPVEVDAGTGPDGAYAPLAVAARFSGAYKCSAERGIDCLPLPEDVQEAADIGFPLDTQPVLPWWHNLRAYGNLAAYIEQYKKAFKADRFPGASVYAEVMLDLSGHRPSRLLYIVNLADGWTANWGTLAFSGEPKLAEGRIEFPQVGFHATHLKAYLTREDALRFRVGGATAPPQSWTDVVRSAAAAGSFRPWWPLYQEWRKAGLETGDPGNASGSLSLALGMADGKPQVELGQLREFFTPDAQRWDPKFTTLEPGERAAELERTVRERFGGVFMFRLFDAPQPLARSEALTEALWSKAAGP